MRLNGIYALPGTFIGRLDRTPNDPKPFVALIADGGGGGCGHEEHLPFIMLREAKQSDFPLGMREPRSIAEHKAIPLRQSVYGPIRMFGPRPVERPPLVKQPSYLEDLQNQKKIKLARRRAARNVELLMKQRKNWGV